MLTIKNIDRIKLFHVSDMTVKDIRMLSGAYEFDMIYDGDSEVYTIRILRAILLIKYVTSDVISTSNFRAIELDKMKTPVDTMCYFDEIIKKSIESAQKKFKLLLKKK